MPEIDALVQAMEARKGIRQSETIPAGFTYLGQFIDHDITFDPVSSLTHLAAALVFALLGPFLIARGRGARPVTSLAVFAFSCVLLLSLSGVYHLLTPGTAGRSVLMRRGPDLPDSTEVLYISPLRALSNDVQKNLQGPLREIQALDVNGKLVGLATTYADGDVLAPGGVARYSTQIMLADKADHFEFTLGNRVAD
mgnify:CR=1 FL=1